MKLAAAAFSLLLAAPSAALARPCDEGRLSYLESALIADRLIQSESMIASLQRDCAAHPRYNALAARFALRTGRAADANRLYAALAAQEPGNVEYAGGVGLSALQLGQDDLAVAWLTRAAAASSPDWHVFNALGIVHDRRGEWQAAGEAYARAAELAPYEASVWSNRGYSLMLQRHAAEAVPLLERAAALDPNNAAIRRNLALATAMTGVYDDARRAGETSAEYARRLNNLGYGAWLAGDSAAARRLLSRAIEVSETRFERAEHNLARVEGRE